MDDICVRTIFKSNGIRAIDMKALLDAHGVLLMKQKVLIGGFQLKTLDQ